MDPSPRHNVHIKLSIDYHKCIWLNYCKTGDQSQMIDNKPFETPAELDGYISELLESCKEPTDFSVGFTDSARSFLEKQNPDYCSKISKKLEIPASEPETPAGLDC
jgi:hypothetical protein